MKAFARSAGYRIRQLGRTAAVRVLLVGLLSLLVFGAAGPSGSVLQRVASWPGVTRGTVRGMDVSGHHAFVAIGEGGLMILDLSDPARPTRVGTFLPGGRTELVQVVGSRAYVATLFHAAAGCEQEAWRTRLSILNITDPVHPTLLGSYNTILETATLWVDGNLVYLGETGPELSAFRIVDVSNPARPRPLRVDGNGAACGIWTTSNRAYVVSWSTLKVLDVSNPSRPVELASADLSVQGLTGASNRLYALDSSRLSIYDVGTNAAPTLLGYFTPGGDAPAGVHVSGNRACIAMRKAGLVVADISDPARPVRLGSIDTPGYATAVRTFGEYALIADTYGIQVVDLRDPAHPALLSSYDTGLTTRGIRVVDGRAYVLSADYNRNDSAEARSRLEILDVENPTRPVLLGTYETPEFVKSWDVRAGLAYLACSFGTSAPCLEIVDVAYPPDPLRLSRTALVGQGDYSRVGVCVTLPYAYVARDGTLDVFDVSAPAKPVRVSQTAMANGGYAIQVMDDRAYVASDWEFQIRNVADPKQPALVGSAAFEQGGNGGACLQVLDGFAYSGAGWEGLRITDVHTPTNPVLMGSYDTLGEVHGLCVADRRAFVAEGEKGITLFDVSDPGRPAPINRFETCGQAYGVQLSGDYVFIAEGGAGLTIASVPRNPVQIIEASVVGSAALGEAGTLAVSAYGRGPLTYQWYAGLAGDLSHPFAEATNAWFTTPAVTQTAPYWVRVSSSTGSAESRTAWVNPVPPVRLELVGTWPGYRRGPASCVQLSGNLAYVAAGDLQIWDLTEETSPQLVTTYGLNGGYLNSLTVSGNLALLCCDSQQLMLLDISRPATPTLLGSFTATNESISRVTIVGSIAYAAGNLFRILDISKPSLPSQIATLSLAGTAVAVQAGYAYLVGNQALWVINVTNPAQPRLVSTSYPFRGSACNVQVVGNYAYVAESARSDGPNRIPGGLAIVDISNPSLPRVQLRTQPGGKDDARDLAVLGTNVYLANVDLHVIDVRNPAAPVVVGTLTNNYAPTAVVVSGQRAYLAGEDGVKVVDISAPYKMKPLQLIPTSGSVQDVASFDNHVVLADSAGGLVTLDVANPRQPVCVSAYRTNESPFRVAVNDGVACFVAVNHLYERGPLHIVDLGAPGGPAHVGDFPRPENGWFSDVVASDEYVILAAGTLTTLDVRVPSEPKVVCVDPVDTLDETADIAVRPPYLFLAQGWEGMHIVDFSVPAEPTRLAAYFTEAPARGIAVGRDLACLVLGPEIPGLEVVDIRDPRNPVQTASIPLPVVNSVALSGNYACVTGDLLRVFDLTDPYRPVQVASHDPGCGTYRLQASGDLVYVAAAEYGLAIYRLTPELRLDAVVVDGNGLRLSWVGQPGIKLQRTSSLEQPVWQDVPYTDGASSLQLSPANAAGFFRLVRP